jgi:hypothetical protein
MVLAIPTVAIGWICEVCAWILFGSFGVPMKHPSVIKAGVDPLMYQSWKTGVFFITSWLVLAWTDFAFTPFGLLSGLFWVPGGTLAILSVQNAGLASGLGVVQGCIVLVSFFWSLAIFREPMWSIGLTVLGVAALITGIVGMSFSLRPSSSKGDAAVTPLIQAPEVDSKEVSINEDPIVSFGCFRIRKFTFGILMGVGSGLFGGSGLGNDDFN